MPKCNKSSRADGRGGWTAGKRRNPDCGDWTRIRINLAALLADRWQRGVISGSALARDLGVGETTVRRWLDGTDRPSVECQEAVRQWVTEKRKATK